MIHYYSVSTQDLLIISWHKCKTSQDGLKLNLDKCINIIMNRVQSHIKFVNGDKMPRKHKATYLGVIVTDENRKSEEIISRIAACNQTANRLKLFWNMAETSINWKLRVFDAVLRSKLLYGLETMELTEQELNKLNAFQIKCIRRILKLELTCINRDNANEAVLVMAEAHRGKPIKPFSQSCTCRLIHHAPCCPS